MIFAKIAFMTRFVLTLVALLASTQSLWADQKISVPLGAPNTILKNELQAIAKDCKSWNDAIQYNCYIESIAKITSREIARRKRAPYGNLLTDAQNLMYQMADELVTVVNERAHQGLASIAGEVSNFTDGWSPREFMRSIARRWLQVADQLAVKALENVFDNTDLTWAQKEARRMLWGVCANFEVGEDGGGPRLPAVRGRLLREALTLLAIEEPSLLNDADKAWLTKMRTTAYFILVTDSAYDCDEVHELIERVVHVDVEESAELSDDDGEALVKLAQLRHWLVMSGYSNRTNLVGVNSEIVATRNLRAAALAIKISQGNGDPLAAAIDSLADLFADRLKQNAEKFKTFTDSVATVALSVEGFVPTEWDDNVALKWWTSEITLGIVLQIPEKLPVPPPPPQEKERRRTAWERR